MSKFEERMVAEFRKKYDSDETCASTHKSKRIQELLKEWEKVALCTDPANWDEADGGLREVYRLSGNPQPLLIKHAPSPYVGILIAWCCLNSCDAFGKKLERKDLVSYITDTDFVALYPKTTINNMSNIYSMPFVSNGFGSLDAGWISYHLYELETTGKCSVPTLAGIEKIARNAGWWWSFNDVGIICDRCSILKINASIQLHCDDGPAIAYRCGKKDYFLNGIKVNEQIVERPRTITRDQILAEENLEKRKIMVERSGI